MPLQQRLSRYYLIAWTTLVFLFAWLPLVRCILDGDTYEWGTTHFGYTFRGTGLEGDLWFLTVKLAIGFAALYGICRWWRPGLLLAMAVAMVHFSDSLFSYLTAAEPLIFRGDTLGVEFDIGLASAVLGALAAATAVVLAAAWAKLPPYCWLDTANRRLLIVLLTLLPVQFLLLRFGEPHGTTDAVGVILTILQWLAVPWALRYTEVTPGLSAR